MIVFPNSPTVNQEFSAVGKTWVWNGYGWDLKIEEGLPVPDITSLWDADSGIDSFGFPKYGYIKPIEGKVVHVDNIERILASKSITRGYLYNYAAAITGGFITDMRVPTSIDWDNLITYLGGTAIAGTKLKDTSWGSGTNEVGLKVLANGIRQDTGTFANLDIEAVLWGIGLEDAPYNLVLTVAAASTFTTPNIRTGAGIRLVMNTSSTEPDGSIIDSVKDNDGNRYNLIKVGNTAWLARNLVTTSYADGTPITLVEGDSTWAVTLNPSYSAYDNTLVNAYDIIPGLLHPVAASGSYLDLEDVPIIPDGFIGFDISNIGGTAVFTVGSEDVVTIEGSGDTSVTVDPITKKIVISSTPGSGDISGVSSFNTRTGAVLPAAGDYTTDLIAEGSGLYFTETRVRNTPLSGLLSVDAPVVSTDNILSGIGKLQGQINTKAASNTNLTINGHSGAIAVTGGTQNLTANRTWGISLTPVGIIASTYTKLTVDIYGRVTTGEQLTAADIPNISANKITTDILNIARIPVGTTSTTVAAGNHVHTFVSITGKPTTLAGYGITDAVSSSHIGSGGTAHAVATTGASGFMSSADKLKLNGIAAGAQANVPTDLNLGTRTSTTLGVDSSTGTDIILPAVTTTLSGLMAATDKIKLDGVQVGAQVNVSTNLSISARGTTGIIVASSTGTGVTLPASTTGLSGLMSSYDKTKLETLQSMGTKIFWTGTETAFNAIPTKNVNTIYFVEEV